MCRILELMSFLDDDALYLTFRLGLYSFSLEIRWLPLIDWYTDWYAMMDDERNISQTTS